jgi:hypothetical protein
MNKLTMAFIIMAIVVSVPFANARDQSRDWLMHEWKEQVADQHRLEAVWHARTPAARAEMYQNYVYNNARRWAPFGN